MTKLKKFSLGILTGLMLAFVAIGLSIYFFGGRSKNDIFDDVLAINIENGGSLSFSDGDISLSNSKENIDKEKHLREISSKKDGLDEDAMGKRKDAMSGKEGEGIDQNEKSIEELLDDPSLWDDSNVNPNAKRGSSQNTEGSYDGENSNDSVGNENTDSHNSSSGNSPYNKDPYGNDASWKEIVENSKKADEDRRREKERIAKEEKDRGSSAQNMSAEELAKKKAEEEKQKKMKEVEQLIGNAKDALRQGKTDDALSLFSQADASMPKDEKDFSSKKYEEIADSLNSGRKNSGNPQNAKKMTDNAEHYIKKAITDNDKNAKGHFTYSDIADALAKDDLSLKELEKAVQLDGNNFEYNYALGKKYFEKKEYQKAKQCFEKSVRLNSLSDAAFYNLGLTNRRLGKDTDASRAFGSAVRLRPSHVKANIELARISKGQKNLQASISYYAKALALEPANFVVLKELAQTYAEAGQKEKAEKHFIEAIDKGEGDATTFYNLATVQLDLNKKVEALNNAKKCIGLDKSDPRFLYTYGLALEKNNNYEEAITSYAEAIAKNDKFVKARINLGRLYLETGNYDKAEDELSRAYNLEKQNYETNTNLGKLYGLKKDWEKSIFHYTESVKMQPRNVVAISNLALSYISAGDMIKAIEQYKRIISIDKTSYDSYYEIGRLYISLGKKEEASSIWKELLQKKPNYPKREEMLKILVNL